MTAVGDGVEAFGALLQRHRHAAGLSQQELAERAGLSLRGLADLERGARRSPYPATVRVLAEALELPEPERAALLAAARPQAAQGRALESEHAGGLPLPLSSFIGREQEAAAVERLLSRTRLLTLVGSGGIGKTRLALRVAADLVPEYTDGIWLVELAPLADPVLVPRAVAAVLDVREQPGRPLQQTLADALRERRLLLLLDNCEHQVGECAHLAAALLGACPTVTILATSREALGLTGETVWRVPSLTTPDARAGPPLERLVEYEAVRLFVERATAARPDFQVTEQNAPAVGKVCRRLDGIPLALELAAARVPLLSVEQIAARLDHGFQLLTGGSRTAPSRQRTLGATIDWSYQLLSEAEQHLFERLSVFAGACTLEAAEAVCAGDPIQPEVVLDLLAGLVNKSLVLMDERGGQARYALLETLRQYGQARLAASGHLDAMRRQHAAFFLSLAEDAAPHLDRAGQAVWLSRLELEHDNLRAGLGWLLDQGCVDDARRLGVALWLFWSLRGHLGEGRVWLARILALPGEQTPVWARVLFGAGLLAYQQGDPTPMEPLHEHALAFWQQRGDQAEIASNLHRLGDLARMRGDYARARELLEQGLAASRRAEHRGTEAWCLGCLGYVAYFEGDYVLARDQQMEALRLFRQVGSERGVAMMLRNVGMALHHLGDLAAARPFLEDALAKARDMDEKWLVALATQPLGEFALDAGEIATAQALLVESMRLRRELGDSMRTVWALDGLVQLVAAQGQAERAVRLAGAAAAWRERLAAPASVTERAQLERWLGPARAALGEGLASTAWALGRALSLEQAVVSALEAAVAGERQRGGPRRPRDTLTAREREVAALVAGGLSTRAIAEALVITEATARVHVERILNKLDLHSRVQLAAWALQHGLAPPAN